MPTLLEILDDPSYKDANLATKQAIFNKYAPLDPSYESANGATKAAIQEGVVAGGGVALLYAREAIDRCNKGANIVYKACGKAFEQILVNAGYDSNEAIFLGKSSLVNKGEFNRWSGIDIETGNVIDFKEKGIIDPTKVTRLALENAASIAGTVLLTECTITEDKSDSDKMNTLQNNASATAGMEDYM